MIDQLKKDLYKLANPEKAKVFARFFKTGKGEYGEGDIFLGIMTEPLRQIANTNKDLPLLDLQELLNGKFHEERSIALSILTRLYEKAEKEKKEGIAKFYLENTKNINNWDLVDISAPKILGDYFFERDRNLLYKLARSESLWERRIAIMTILRLDAKAGQGYFC